MYNSRWLIIYPFPTSHLNWSWWSYPCILPLIFSIAWLFKFFVGQKENHFNLFYHVFYQGDSIRHEWYAKKFVTLSNIAKKVHETTFFNHSNVVILRYKDNPQRVFRRKRSWLRNYIYFLVASLIITITFHCTLYLIHNECSRRLEKIRGNIKRFSTLSWP